MDRIAAYLEQSRVRLPLEDPRVHVPPTAQEAREVIAELQRRGLEPVIVGSVAVFHHLDVEPHAFRPTADLDLFVIRPPGPPPAGFRVDPTSPGVLSWISPAGGYIDLMIAGQELVNGNRSPLHVRRASNRFDADLLDLLKMKLNTMRERDLSDSISLIRALGRTPHEEEFGTMSDLQVENLDLAKLWLTRLQQPS